MAAAGPEWVMNQSSSTKKHYWQRKREAAVGSTSTYDPPIVLETLRFEGFAPGPRDNDAWSLDRLVATDRQYLWEAAWRNLGLVGKAPKLPSDLMKAVAVMRTELTSRVDRERFPHLWNSAHGAFVFLSPKPMTPPAETVVWRDHTSYTSSSQWTSLELMPNRLLQQSYANRSVHTLPGKLKKLESAASPLEGMNLYHLVRGNNVKRSLEVGMACGLSTLYILQGMVDAHQDEVKKLAALGSDAHGPKHPHLAPQAAAAAGASDHSAPASASASASAPTTTTTPEPAAAASVSSASSASAARGWKPRDHLVLADSAFHKLPPPDAATDVRARAAAAAGYQHVSVDPYQLTQWKGAARSQVRVAGLEALSSHLLLPSHLAMPAVERELGEGCMDLVFVDGMHLFDYTLVDLFLADRLTRVGGLIVLDDVKHAGVKDCVHYIMANYPHWQLLTGTACERTASTWVKHEPDLRKWNFHVAAPYHAHGAASGKRPRGAAYH
jgi:predicted O-methyltransferase YrrM